MKRINGRMRGQLASPDYGTTLSFRSDGSIQSAVVKATNPRTLGQTYQRLKMPNLGTFHAAAKVALDKAYQGMVSNIFAQLVKYNATIDMDAAIGLTKQQKAMGAGISFPYVVSQGSLSPVHVEQGVTDIWFDGITSITASTTLGAFSKAVVDGNLGLYRYGDRITFVCFTQGMEKGLPVIGCSYKAVTLVEDSEDLPFADGNNMGFAYSGGRLGLKGGAPVGCYAWIRSRIDENGNLLLSTQQLINNNASTIAAYTTADRLRKAAESYNANVQNPVVLEPTTTKAKRVMARFGYSASDFVSEDATASGSILNFQYLGKTYLPGDTAPVLSKEAGSLKINVTNGSLLASGMIVKINDTAVSSPTRSNNEITAQIPASLDGVTFESINISDGANNWTFEL